jgi:ribosome modulation factor
MSERMSLEAAYNTGYVAGLDGDLHNDAPMPYEDGTAEAEAWREGYSDGAWDN